MQIQLELNLEEPSLDHWALVLWEMYTLSYEGCT